MSKTRTVTVPDGRTAIVATATYTGPRGGKVVVWEARDAETGDLILARPTLRSVLRRLQDFQRTDR